MEPGLVQTLLDVVADHESGLGPLVLFLSSLIEYVFPPFPGDVITLFGTYLVVRGLWSFGFALALSTGGSLVGATIGYWVGVWVGKRFTRLPEEREAARFALLPREKFTLLCERFRRHGSIYIALNRFLPGIRAFFFVAAGAARMPIAWVLLWALVSAVAWNSLLLCLGLIVGANWERLQALFSTYTTAIWIALGLFVVALIVRALLRRRRSSTEEP